MIHCRLVQDEADHVASQPSAIGDCVRSAGHRLPVSKVFPATLWPQEIASGPLSAGIGSAMVMTELS